MKRADAFAAHVADLARQHNVSVKPYAGKCGGRANRKARTIKIRAVKSSITYAYALHEIGHVVGPQGRLRIDKEVQAWEWAKAQAVEWTDRMQQEAAKALSSYVSRANRRKGMVAPTPGHPIFEWINKD